MNPLYPPARLKCDFRFSSAQFCKQQPNREKAVRNLLTVTIYAWSWGHFERESGIRRTYLKNVIPYIHDTNFTEITEYYTDYNKALCKYIEPVRTKKAEIKYNYFCRITLPKKYKIDRMLFVIWATNAEH